MRFKGTLAAIALSALITTGCATGTKTTTRAKIMDSESIGNQVFTGNLRDYKYTLYMTNSGDKAILKKDDAILIYIDNNKDGIVDYAADIGGSQKPEGDIILEKATNNYREILRDVEGKLNSERKY